MNTIPLTQGKVALVDDELFDELNKHKWSAHLIGKTFYSVRGIRLHNGRKAVRYMHQEVFLLLGEEINSTVDHRDFNGLNNQRYNLRPASKAEQTFHRRKYANNKSGYTGVHLFKRTGKWRAYANVGGKEQHLGYFDDPAEAARARDAYVKEHHGKFAVLNFEESQCLETAPAP